MATAAPKGKDSQEIPIARDSYGAPIKQGAASMFSGSANASTTYGSSVGSPSADNTPHGSRPGSARDGSFQQQRSQNQQPRLRRNTTDEDPNDHSRPPYQGQGGKGSNGGGRGKDRRASFEQEEETEGMAYKGRQSENYNVNAWQGNRDNYNRGARFSSNPDKEGRRNADTPSGSYQGERERRGWDGDYHQFDQGQRGPNYYGQRQATTGGPYRRSAPQPMVMERLYNLEKMAISHEREINMIRSQHDWFLVARQTELQQSLDQT